MFRPLLVLTILAPAAAASGKAIDFNRDVRPILSENCFFCHGPDAHERKADLRLDSYEGATQDNGGTRAIDPENLAGSELLYRITEEDPDEVMPPPGSHKNLSPAQVETLTAWVKSGAPYSEHWAFAPIASPEPPEAGKGWAHNPIDRFIFDRLEEAGLEPSPEADPATLLRRVTFDLTGLPPSQDAIEAFLKDPSPQAYADAVDGLLASEAYGERMATSWLDIARYGDSSVMHADGVRTMWPWRDWVINAYNANKPFDEFTVEQLAGDLLPEATLAQKIASGFNRNSASSDEGGAFPEELRVGYAIDRVQTTSNTWLGLSVECAQCHDHKYDPVSQKEYYEFFAYFNQAADPGMQNRNGNQEPLVKFFADPELEKKHAAALAGLTAASQAVQAHIAGSEPEFQKWAAATDPAGLPEPPGLVHHFPLDPSGGATFTDAVTGETPSGTEDSSRGSEIFAAKRTAVSGEPADGVDFEGTVARTYSNHIAPFSQDDPFTVAAWIYTPNNEDGKAIVSRMAPAGGDSSHRGFDIWTEGLTVGTHIVYRWDDRAIKVLSKQRMEPDTWQHVVVSYDGSRQGSGVSIYFDGKRSETTITTDTLKNGKESAVADAPFRIASRGGVGVTVPAGIGDLRIYDRVLDGMERDRIGTNSLSRALVAAAPTPEQTAELKTYYLSSVDPDYQALLAAERDLQEQIRDLEGKQTSSMIMGDVEEHRQTYVLDRGAYDAPKEDAPVQPGVPAAFPPLPDGAPANRLGLARWIVAEDNPLTARVTMNRYWSMFFGRGLVATVADFGNQGSVPTHPELLDWLASDFRSSGWNVKRAIRQIVTSATYRQQSHRRDDLTEKDPENLLLARSPRFRLQGEFIRDAALKTSGLLVDQVGGESVKPYQPAGLWNEVSLDANVRFVQDEGEDLYRRSLYTYWKRSAPQPAMTTFDAPTREICTIERPRTNTPLQALVTLNDTQFVEASRAFAQRVLKEAGDTDRERITFAFRVATARDPDEREILLVAEALGGQLAAYRGDPAKAKALIETGDSPRDESLDPVEHAAWTNIATLLLNLDETITRG